MLSLKSADFDYVLVDSRNSGHQAKDLYCEAFRLWNQVWDQTLFELDGAPLSASDEFTRQDAIGALYYGGRCVGLSCFRQVDLQMLSARKDSYFKIWSQEALAALVQDGSKILVTTNLTVDPEFRGDLGIGLKMKYFLVGLQVKVLMSSSADVQALVPRCDRGMDKVVYRYGATAIDANAQLHGVPVSLTGAYRRKLLAQAPLFELPIEVAWRSHRSFGPNLMDTGLGLNRIGLTG